jgi:hypothetical protein
MIMYEIMSSLSRRGFLENALAAFVAVAATIGTFGIFLLTTTSS